MRKISTDEAVELGEHFSIDIDESRAERVVAQTNDLLDDLEELDEIPVERRDADPMARSWQEPSDDPHNALSVVCQVPPTGAGELSDLSVGIKDVIAVAGVPLRCGSAVMSGFVSPIDATVVSRLRSAGASIDAKTNLDEFAGSARGTTGVGSPITNPYDESRTAGGSSGGSAVAVATERVDAALGTDTGGSVRIPASFCGVVGLKPTYGLIPLTGVVENTYTQDHVGVFTRNVRGAARVLDAVAGTDERDPASLAAAGRREQQSDSHAAGGADPIDAGADPIDASELHLGVIEEGIGDGVSSQVVSRTEAAIDRLSDAGVTVSRVSIQGFHDARPIKNALSFVELATHWRDGGAPYRRGGVDEIYQSGFARARSSASGELDDFYVSKLLAGARIVDAHDGRQYVRAQAARSRLRDRFDEALGGINTLLLPTMPDIAPHVEDASDWEYDFARNTRCANVTRHPALSLPNGTVDGLPVGLQLIGTQFGERELLSVGRRVEHIL